MGGREGAPPCTSESMAPGEQARGEQRGHEAKDRERAAGAGGSKGDQAEEEARAAAAAEQESAPNDDGGSAAQGTGEGEGSVQGRGNLLATAGGREALGSDAALVDGGAWGGEEEMGPPAASTGIMEVWHLLLDLGLRGLADQVRGARVRVLNTPMPSHRQTHTQTHTPVLLLMLMLMLLMLMLMLMLMLPMLLMLLMMMTMVMVAKMMALTIDARVLKLPPRLPCAGLRAGHDRLPPIHFAPAPGPGPGPGPHAHAAPPAPLPAPAAAVSGADHGRWCIRRIRLAAGRLSRSCWGWQGWGGCVYRGARARGGGGAGGGGGQPRACRQQRSGTGAP